MHSPIFVDEQPAWETESLPSDWEYYSDDYWDYDSPKASSKKRKRAANDTNAVDGTFDIEGSIKKKRNKLDSGKSIPKVSLGEPTLATSAVIWKSKSEIFNSSESPVISDSSGEKVALLKDWRDRFKYSPKSSSSRSKPRGPHRSNGQRALAVVIDGDSSDTYHMVMPPPTTLENSQDFPSRSNDSQSSIEGKSPSMNDMSDPALSSKLSKKAVTIERKRKADGNLSDGGAVDAPVSKRKRGRPKKQDNVDPTEHHHQKDKQPLTNRTNGVIRTQKRKSEDSEEESNMAPPKRKNPTRGGLKPTTPVSKEPSTRRSTRQTRTGQH